MNSLSGGTAAHVDDSLLAVTLFLGSAVVFWGLQMTGVTNLPCVVTLRIHGIPTQGFQVISHTISSTIFQDNIYQKLSHSYMWIVFHFFLVSFTSLHIQFDCISIAIRKVFVIKY